MGQAGAEVDREGVEVVLEEVGHRDAPQLTRRLMHFYIGRQINNNNK